MNENKVGRQEYKGYIKQNSREKQKEEDIQNGEINEKLERKKCKQNRKKRNEMERKEYTGK